MSNVKKCARKVLIIYLTLNRYTLLNIKTHFSSCIQFSCRSAQRC